jgi:hypothetical protein
VVHCSTAVRTGPKPHPVPRAPTVPGFVLTNLGEGQRRGAFVDGFIHPTERLARRAARQFAILTDAAISSKDRLARQQLEIDLRWLHGIGRRDLIGWKR